MYRWAPQYSTKNLIKDEKTNRAREKYKRDKNGMIDDDDNYGDDKSISHEH